MKVAVAGGTGVAGRYAVETLREQGHEAVVMARSEGVDLLTGEGLAAALAGTDAVIDTTNVATSRTGPATRFFEAVARNLTSAAAQAGAGHVVVLSIIGIDRVPYGYYKAKVRQEEVLRKSAVPVSVLRASQFHEFAGQYLARMKGRVVLVPKWRVQPVAAREVGAELARLATGEPVPLTELAGPGEENMADLIRQVVRARGDRRRVLEVRVPGATGKSMAAGGNLPDRPGLRGTQTFASWLAEQSG